MTPIPDEQLRRYREVAAALAGDGIVCAFQTRHQMTVSRQTGPIWPDDGNSFWVTHATGQWHLFTWSPIGYSLPADGDIVQLCRDCMAHGESAMPVVPDEIVAAHRLSPLTADEQETVRAAMKTG